MAALNSDALDRTLGDHLFAVHIDQLIFHEEERHSQPESSWVKLLTIRFCRSRCSRPILDEAYKQAYPAEKAPRRIRLFVPYLTISPITSRPQAAALDSSVSMCMASA